MANAANNLASSVPSTVTLGSDAALNDIVSVSIAGNVEIHKNKSSDRTLAVNGGIVDRKKTITVVTKDPSAATLQEGTAWTNIAWTCATKGALAGTIAYALASATWKVLLMSLVNGDDNGRATYTLNLEVFNVTATETVNPITVTYTGG